MAIIKQSLTYRERVQIIDLLSQGIELREASNLIRDKVLTIIGFSDKDFRPKNPNEDEAWEALEAVDDAFNHNRPDQAIANLFLNLGLHSTPPDYVEIDVPSVSPQAGGEPESVN